LKEAVAWAMSSGTRLEVCGQGTRRRLGRPVAADTLLDLAGLTGILGYEAEEMVLTALPSTPLATIREILAQRGQILAFEPADYGPLLGEQPDRGSLAGALACNIAGPRRLLAGGARDHILGVKAISGRGELFRAGGKVVKNVTGFDLSKLLCGSFGTLAVMSEITIRVLPRPETQTTLLVPGLSDRAASEAMIAALQGGFEVSGAAHLPAQIAGFFGMDHAVTAFRLEGTAVSVAARIAALELPGTETSLHDTVSEGFWQKVRDVSCFAVMPGPVWRLHLPPASAVQAVEEIAAGIPVRHFYDRAGGQVWILLPDGDPAEAIVRAAAGRAGGQATLIRASEAQRAEIAVFSPPDPVHLGVLRRIKQAYDPKGVLNPGRLHPDL
jgi:glycolate oxidase FAD binding subunit